MRHIKYSRKHTLTMKICILCKVEQSDDCFCKDVSRKDGLNPRCKTCKSKIDLEYRQNNKDKLKAKHESYYQQNSEKIKQKSSAWYEKNKEECNTRMKQYFQDNKVRIKLQQANWNNQNKEKMQAYMNQYIKHKYQNDVQFKVKSILSARLRACIKTKSKSTLDFLGCSLHEFQDWIEFQFDDNMTWQNCGLYWHFDHVKPCSSFDLSRNEDIVQCFNWKNIRPLEAKENMSKNDKVCETILKQHAKIVESFVARRTKG